MFLPGDFGLVHSGTKFSQFVGWLQGLIGDPHTYTHAFIVIDEDNVLEADRREGVRINKISNMKNPIFSQWNLTDDQRQQIINEANSLLGSPYCWLSYVAIGLAYFGIKSNWLIAKIIKKNGFICSQLVYMLYDHAGIKLLDSKYNWLNVTPGRLSYALGDSNV